MAKRARVWTGTEFVDLASSMVNPQSLVPTGVVNPFAGAVAPEGWLLCWGQELPVSGYTALSTLLGTTYGSLTNGSGGAGTTHFRLPDLRGRVVAALDNMGGTDAGRLTLANTLGTTTGAQTHTLTTAEMPVHAHTNTLSSNTVASSTHRHDFGIATLDYNYNAVGPNGGYGTAGQAGAYKYSTSAYAGGTQSSAFTATVAGTNTPISVSATRMTSTGDTNTPSATTTVGITNANAGSDGAHNNMQPTILMNYIIKT
jgi:microcystin-dependent protein